MYYAHVNIDKSIKQDSLVVENLFSAGLPEPQTSRFHKSNICVCAISCEWKYNFSKATDGHSQPLTVQFLMFFSKCLWLNTIENVISLLNPFFPHFYWLFEMTWSWRISQKCLLSVTADSLDHEAWQKHSEWIALFCLQKTGHLLLLKVKLNPSNNTLWGKKSHHILVQTTFFIQTNTLKCGCRNFRLEKNRSTDPYKPTKEFFFIFIY